MNVLLLYLQELLNLQTHGGRGERDRGKAGDRDGGRRQYRDQAEGAQFAVKLIANDDSTFLKR